MSTFTRLFIWSSKVKGIVIFITGLAIAAMVLGFQPFQTLCQLLQLSPQFLILGIARITLVMTMPTSTSTSNHRVKVTGGNEIPRTLGSDAN
ncbi:hypothetical protein ACFX15_012888 [Malus domestica]